jgi:hypothetical protein
MVLIQNKKKKSVRLRKNINSFLLLNGMNTSNKSQAKKSANPIDQLIFEKGIRIADVIIRKKPDVIIVLLNTGHVLKLHLSDFPKLKKSSEKSLNE